MIYHRVYVKGITYKYTKELVPSPARKRLLEVARGGMAELESGSGSVVMGAPFARSTALDRWTERAGDMAYTR